MRFRAVTTALLSLTALGASAEAPSDFAMRQPLEISGDKAFYRVELPDAVYDGAGRADLGDLRVFNGAGALVPFAFMPRPSPLRLEIGRRPLAIFPLTVDTTRANAGDLSISLHRNATGATTVDVRTRDGTPMSGPRIVGYLIDASLNTDPLIALQLQWRSSRSVTARARIDASDDLVAWRTLVADAPLLLLEYNGQRLWRDRIEFASMTSRYLRITWLTPDVPELASVIGDLGERLVDPLRRVRKVPGIAESGGADTFTFDLGAALPIDRITLDLPDVNTVAPVSWQARTTAQDSWQSVGDSVVYRLRRNDGEITNADHAIAPVESRYFRARIDPKSGGVGAAAPMLVAAWYPREIVFAARGDGPFELAYGSRRVTPGALPVEMLVPGYVTQRPLPDNVGVAQAQAPSTANRLAMREPVDVKRWVLWASLVLASLLLGAMALRLAHQMRRDAGAAKPDS